ncbi:PREDICTED: peroxisomal membrane protein 13 isoform X2 [Ipomoea nil]|uniref:peroxisomal membrane protein 13 isoform X2 n=1 Tax=Ipomoea nil TaxID=35883 RepID=UPI000901401C|nr:PREDICTED: peroxisomal membrane protein 13 isoform X2 [Ipomoea nil]XP_019178433.1 PREDICTED: peroxisomal membrane protein 13 isoform X2 [Ipomoea nil]
MENNPQPSGGGSPPKPWERAGSSSGPAPFKPSSPGNTSDVVEASGTANPGEIVTAADRNTAVNRNAVARPVPSRPWEQQQQYGSTYGGYGSGLNYNSGYGMGMSSYGGYGSGGMYGGGLYGNNMYRGGYGGLYGANGGGMYGGGMYNSGLGGQMGGYGMGMGMGMGGPYGEQDPNNPFGAPSSPPGFWVSLMRVMQGVVTFFGRVAILIDQNTQAFHMFMTALLQVCDRSGLLYGELAAFVLRILGVKRRPKKVHHPGAQGLPGPHNPHGNQNFIEGPKAGPTGGWDNVWGNNPNN